MGVAPRAGVDHGHPGSYRPSLDLYWDAFKDWDEPTELGAEYSLAEDFRSGLGLGNQRPVEFLSFLARRIEQHTGAAGEFTVFGSPIWVAASSASRPAAD